MKARFEPWMTIFMEVRTASATSVFRRNLSFLLLFCCRERKNGTIFHVPFLVIHVYEVYETTLHENLPVLHRIETSAIIYVRDLEWNHYQGN